MQRFKPNSQYQQIFRLFRKCKLTCFVSTLSKSCCGKVTFFSISNFSYNTVSARDAFQLLLIEQITMSLHPTLIIKAPVLLILQPHNKRKFKEPSVACTKPTNELLYTIYCTLLIIRNISSILLFHFCLILL